MKTANRNRSVYFKEGNEDFIIKQAKKNNKNFNTQVNDIITEYKNKEKS